MLFNAFNQAVQKYPDSLAINNITYSELFKLVNEHDYKFVCNSTDWTLLVDILKASMLNKPIVILPKFNRDQVVIPKVVPKEFGIFLYSSGSSGVRKQIFMPDRMVHNNALHAVECQRITHEDTILTVCSLNHTGGISAQSLAGLTVGAHIIVEQFNPFNFFKLIEQHNVTLTHLVPIMIDGLAKIKNNRVDVPSLRLVVAGSDCVYKHHVEFWLERNKQFITNYGLTEAGPIIINHEFSPGDDLSIFDHGVPLGTRPWCGVRIVENELHVRGLVVNGLDWLNTGDCVYLHDEWFMYKGRTSAGCKIIPKQY